MSVLRNLEARIEGLVEGVFSRAFSSQVQPVEIARKLAKEMDAHRTASVSRVYVPNSTRSGSRPRTTSASRATSARSARSSPGYLLEHARRHDYALLTRPEVELEVDERLRLGEFGIQTRLVKPPARQGEAPAQGEEGHTMVYSVPPKQTAPASARRPRSAGRHEGDRLARRPPLRARRPGRRPRPLARVRLRARRPERLPPPRRAAPRLQRRLADRRPRLDQRRQGQRPRASTARASRPATTSSSARPASPSTSSSSDRCRGPRLPSRPWTPSRSPSRSSSPSWPSSTCSCSGWRAARCKELRSTARAGARGDRLPPDRRPRRPRRRDRRLAGRPSRAAGSTPGERFDLFGGLTIGRSAEADVRIEDRFASGIHAASTRAEPATTLRT